jgi:hypothetical protein
MSDEDRLVAQIVELLHTKRNSDEPFVLRPTELAALARPAPLQDDAALLRALTLAIKREARPPISQFSVRAQRVKRQTASFPLTFFAAHFAMTMTMTTTGRRVRGGRRRCRVLGREH